MQLSKRDIWAIRDALFLTTLNTESRGIHHGKGVDRAEALHRARLDLLRLFEKELENTSSDDTWTFELN